MRVDQLAARAGVSVDTVRYYQTKGLLDPPRREGRVAWYGDRHLERIDRVRTLQQRGFTLATIVRLVRGELDSADEALVGELTGLTAGEDGAPGGAPGRAAAGTSPGSRFFTLGELADETGIPLALLKAVEAEGLLIPRRIGTEDRYTEEDVEAARAGLLLLEWGVPLPALLDLSRRHHAATEAVAHEAVELFAVHVRGALRDDPAAGPAREGGDEGGSRGLDDPTRLVQAFGALLPAVSTLVGHHFTRALLKAAIDHVEQVGSDAERQAVLDQAGAVVAGAEAGGSRSGR